MRPPLLREAFFVKNKLENKKKKCILAFEYIFGMQKITPSLVLYFNFLLSFKWKKEFIQNITRM